MMIKGATMNNREELVKYYESVGYKYLGYVNTSVKAHNAALESVEKQWHEIGRNLHLVACHDLKVYFIVDSGD